MLTLLLLAGLTASSLCQHFSHFPLVSRRSDQLPPPPPPPVEHLQSPTGRPGLPSQQERRDRETERLVALLAAPRPPSGGEGGGRTRQKLGRLLEDRARGQQRGRKEAGKLNIQRRLRAGPGRNINSLDVEQKIEKPAVLRARSRPRNRSPVRQKNEEQGGVRPWAPPAQTNISVVHWR